MDSEQQGQNPQHREFFQVGHKQLQMKRRPSTGHNTNNYQGPNKYDNMSENQCHMAVLIDSSINISTVNECYKYIKIRSCSLFNKKAFRTAIISAYIP